MPELFCRTGQRSRTAGAATGRVLEVGIGAGLNLPFYVNAEEIVGVDPDPSALKRAGRRAGSARCPVRLVRARAESLPLAAGQFDAVVVTFVLCTVPDPGSTLREARRVMRPSGRLFFLEHVRSRGPRVARMQDVLTPAWSLMSHGCHLNRRSLEAIARYFTIDQVSQRGVVVEGRARPRIGDRPPATG